MKIPSSMLVTLFLVAMLASLLLLSVIVVHINTFNLCINGRLQGGGQETESPRGPEHGPRSLPILVPVLMEIRKYDL